MNFSNRCSVLVEWVTHICRVRPVTQEVVEGPPSNIFSHFQITDFEGGGIGRGGGILNEFPGFLKPSKVPGNCCNMNPSQLVTGNVLK